MKPALRLVLGLLAAVAAHAPLLAQAVPDQAPEGRLAPSPVGQAGQRQTRESEASTINAAPLARIDNRLQNRVQNRISNRVDQNYDPQANATSSFSAAQDQVRAPVRSR